MRARWPWPLLAAAMLCKGILWSLTLPPFFGSDESVHFDYAQYIATTGRLPVSSEMFDGADNVNILADAILVAVHPGEAHARFYLERAGTGSVGKFEAAANNAASNPGPHNRLGEYGPVMYVLYAAAIRVAGTAVTSQVELARLVSVLAGVAASLAVAWAARRAGLARQSAIAAAAFVGFQPMWSNQTAIVTADAGLLLFTTLTLALLLEWWRRPRALTALAATVAATAAVFSKPAAVFILPFLLVFARPAVVAGLARGARVRPVAAALAAMAIPSLLFAAWQASRHGVTITGPATHGILAYFTGEAADKFQHWLSVAAGSWGVFGYGELRLPRAIDVPIAALSLVIVALGAVAAIRPRPGNAGAARLLALFAVANMVFVILYELARWRTTGERILEGRFLLPSLPPLVILAFMGMERLLPPHRARTAAFASVLVALLLATVALQTIWAHLYLT